MAAHLHALLALVAALAHGLLVPGPARAAFEWTGPAGTRGAAGHPTAAVAVRGVAGGPGWRLVHHCWPALPELTAQGGALSWAGARAGAEISLGLAGPRRQREIDLGVTAAAALPADLGAVGWGAHLLTLHRAGLPPQRRWTPELELALRRRGWTAAAHGRGPAPGLATAQLAVAVQRRAAAADVTARLTRGGRRPWRLILAARYRLGAGWHTCLSTRSAPRQFGLALSWRLGAVRLRHQLVSHAALGPHASLALAGGGAAP